MCNNWDIKYFCEKLFCTCFIVQKYFQFAILILIKFFPNKKNVTCIKMLGQKQCTIFIISNWLQFIYSSRCVFRFQCIFCLKVWVLRLKLVNSLLDRKAKRFPMNLPWKDLKLDNQIVIIFLLKSEV